MLDFWGGVNVTLGLPIVRTSPDHGVVGAAGGLVKQSVGGFRTGAVDTQSA